ncbi:hypothetical protein Ahy_A06g029397 [Arachis hypogaea]|uniref:MULE transposase domain-containing protein n=1 Tax=Arachis hypogaea TaxID=3818 RepID=A0A445CT79_ARAHY|nr:hypothetical protein Ahy_A06g029397 [Arachis hypogaea]
MYYYGNGLFHVEEDPMTNETFVVETESISIGASQANDQRDVIVLDGISSLGAPDFDALGVEEIMMIEFMDSKTSYDFYNEYGQIKGFFIRWLKVGRCEKYDFSIFGDVMEFDATYGRNKYICSHVIFSRVDHHMRIVVFGCAVLLKEGEENYVCFLQAFLEAMKGKAPKFVITDSDQAMKSAIKAVFQKHIIGCASGTYYAMQPLE